MSEIINNSHSVNARSDGLTRNPRHCQVAWPKTSMLRSSFFNTSTFQRSLRRLTAGSQRHHTAVTTSPVELHYTELIPPDGNKTDRALVILHGLLGSKRNWTSLTKAFLRDLNRPVYALVCLFPSYSFTKS
ncbi:uncharacterized protein BT62DRAFT_206269 [Guyanagaster necrorhizus]|uniref:Uncharacterized protein n=1 Tax=Guyanagaster necrorhizus TaxID=856835 RepID=A0A9P7VPJ1_9AGAR|nr:uncharacterized protein BT62DRAFT_206269 [Guyanagaster necrorhizus MCA 3950]KAG7445033.1 hypothetical protein BT62DRAFT_206269 [Guyanagaster necrorhizus MCA 3950]